MIKIFKNKIIVRSSKAKIPEVIDPIESKTLPKEIKKNDEFVQIYGHYKKVTKYSV